MSRLINPVPEYRPSSKLYFFNSRTNTPMTTYKDNGETIPNSHPVLCDALGNVPNVFYTGSAKLIVLDENDVQYIERDPVGGENFKGEFSLWDPSISYNENAIVGASNSEYYISLQSGNENNNPITSPDYWSLIRFVEVYNANKSYSKGIITQTSDGSLWKSEKDNNIGNNPITDNGNNWSIPTKQKRKDTATVLINSTSTVNAGDVVTVDGYSVVGDSDPAQWAYTGNTIAASQSPSQTGTATLSDALGNEYSLIFSNELDTTRLGALVDGDSAVIAALASAKNKGVKVILPLNQSTEFSGVPWVVEGCSLEGGFSFILSDYETGGFVHTTDEVNEVISLNAGGAIKGVGFYHPNQLTGASPIVYPPVIKLDNSNQSENNVINDNVFVNSYVGIDLNGSIGNANILTSIIDNRFCCINKCINHPYTLTECFFRGNDASYVYWQESVGQPIRGVINNSAIFLDLGDCDGTQVTNNTIFGMGVGVRFYSTSALTTVASNMFDGCYRGYVFAEGVSIGTLTSGDNTFSCKDPISGATDCKGWLCEQSSGVSTGTINSFGDMFPNTDGDHIYFDITGTAQSFIRMNVNGSFISPGRNDTASVHYGVYINDQGSSMHAKIEGVFEDPVNQLSGQVTAVYADGLDVFQLNGTFESMPKGVEIGNSNPVSRFQVGGVFRNVTEELIDNSNEGQLQVTHIYSSEVPASQITVPSASTVTIPASTFKRINVSGTTVINEIEPTFYDDEVTLIFNGGLTVVDGGNLSLAGNFITTGGDSLTLVCDGTNWTEISRSVN